MRSSELDQDASCRTGAETSGSSPGTPVSSGRRAIGSGVTRPVTACRPISPDGPFSEGPDADVWLEDGGVLYRVRHGRAEPVSSRAHPVFGWRSFYVDDEGSTWLGSTATGLHRVIDATITVHPGTDALTLQGAYPILEDRTGAIWLNNSGGLKRYSNGRWTAVPSPRIVDPDAVRSIYEDKSGRLWVGTSSAVGFIDRGRYSRYAEDSPFLNDWISAILEDRTGAFWFAASSGLVRSVEGQLTKYTTSDGLSHDRVISLFEDRTGVSVDRHVSRAHTVRGREIPRVSGGRRVHRKRGPRVSRGCRWLSVGWHLRRRPLSSRQRAPDALHQEGGAPRQRRVPDTRGCQGVLLDGVEPRYFPRQPAGTERCRRRAAQRR